MKPQGAAGARERMLFYLKTRGPQTARQLAERLSITPTGARQHLETLLRDGAVAYEEERRSVGRPVRVWRLTERGQQGFPEGYADLTLDFLEAARSAFGEEGVQKLVAQRTKKQLHAYRERLGAAAGVSRRVAALARLRSEEGYMAEWSKGRDGSFTLVENHCPICVAAESCQGLCQGELELFRKALGKGVRVEREEHVLQGDRRCTYRILEV